MVRPAFRHSDLMDDLAMQLHAYLLEISTEFKGSRFVLIPVTEIVKKFERNHRTIQRRLSALQDEGLLETVIKKQTISLYHVKDQVDQP